MIVEQQTCYDLMREYDRYIFIDVRSPSEFARGHISGAYNIPLFSDHIRALVGACYVQQGREPAMHLAMQHVGPQLDSLVQQAQELLQPSPGLWRTRRYPVFAPKPLVLSPPSARAEPVEAWREGSKGVPEQILCVYCARGGMRSASVSWLFTQFKLPVVQMSGGYKAFRNWAIEQCEQPRSVIIISGKTGAGKTAYLHTLAKNGQQIIDLEKLAQHKGSVFGGTRATQATQQQFENDLAWQWALLAAEKTVFVEDESRKIGAVIIPEPIWTLMQHAPIYYLDMPRDQRLVRIMTEYGVLDKTFLQSALAALAQQLGIERYNQIARMLEQDCAQAAALLLDYYDAKYDYQKLLKAERIVKIIS
jgi:tRNA 2-selenouridine synthase